MVANLGENVKVTSTSVKILNETKVVCDPNLTCTCEFQPFPCEACDFIAVSKNLNNIGEGEAGIRKRFKSDKENEDTLRTSDFDEDDGGWIERDPETTQTFKRKEKVCSFLSILH